MLKTTIFFFAVFVMFGCKPDIPKSRYNLDKCKIELLNSIDYGQNGSIDSILIIKKNRKMYLYKDGKVKMTIPISLGKNPVGRKEKQGDNKTPEGNFFIHRKLCSSKYYRSLCISYPNPKDKARARARGLNPGGNITIHAQPTWNADGRGDSYTLAHNWTQGCIAVTNSAMDKLWYWVHEGVRVTIR